MQKFTIIIEFLKGLLSLKNAQNKDKSSSTLWDYSLRTASRNVKIILEEAGITGIRSSSKSLRHGYAVSAIQLVHMTLLRKWLGHATLETTAIYLNILGSDERKIARKL